MCFKRTFADKLKLAIIKPLFKKYKRDDMNNNATYFTINA